LLQSDKEEKGRSAKDAAEVVKMDSGDDAVERDESERERKKKKSNSEEVVKPRPLHKTASIFLRNLAPTITKQEVEAVSAPCKQVKLYFTHILKIEINYI
jgi:RNA recognition motif-containing protein